MERFEELARQLREAETIEALKVVYGQVRQSFVDDEITMELYHRLRNQFHNMVVLKF